MPGSADICKSQQACFSTLVPQALHWRSADVSCIEPDALPEAGSLSEPGTPAALAAQMSAESFNRTTALMSRGGRGSLDTMRCVQTMVSSICAEYSTASHPAVVGAH